MRSLDPDSVKKRQLLTRIIELNKILGSDVTELFYGDYEIPSLEDELEHLESLIEDDL